MDHWDYMDDRTYRALEQTGRQAAERMAPLLNNNPAISDLAKWTAPPGVLDGALAAINRDTSSVMETALAGSRVQSQFINDQIASTAKAGLKDLFPGPGITSQLMANLDFAFKPPTIADYLARTGTTSIFAFHGPTIAEQMGARIDTKALMGLAGLTETAGTIAEQWRLANTGALSSFGESFSTLRAALDFEQSLKASTAARAFLFESRKLQDDQVRKFAETKLTAAASTRVSEELAADEDLSLVAAHVRHYFVSYLAYTPEQAQNIVKWAIIIFLATLALYAHHQGGDNLNDTVEFGIGMVAMPAIVMTSTKAANTLITDGTPDTTD